jgi:hypothetical protein
MDMKDQKLSCYLFSKVLPVFLLLSVFVYFQSLNAQAPDASSKGASINSSAGSPQSPLSPNSGPTEVVKIIDPDNGPGTDYTSLDDFAHNEKRDLVSANEIAVALCRSSNGSADGPAQFYDWVTDAEHYVKIVADEGHRASAKWDDSKYRIIEYTTINSECIDVEIDHIVIDGIQMYITGSGPSNDVIDPEQGKKFIIKNCFLWMDLSSNDGYGIDLKSDADIFNCIFKGTGYMGIQAMYSATVNAFNNTFIGWKHAIRSEAVVRAVNNISREATGEPFAVKDNGIYTADSDYNSSDQPGKALVNAPRNSSHSPWYSGAAPNRDIFVDADHNDYHLKPNTIFGRKGIGPGANPGVAAYDIDLESRSGPKTDLGADFEPSPVGINDATPEIPQSLILYPNYPNPFNPSTNIAFDTGRLAVVLLGVYDIVGNKIRTLVDEMLPAGRHHLQWDGRDDLGKPVASGIYFYRLKVDRSSQTRKMHLLR